MALNNVENLGERIAIIKLDQIPAIPEETKPSGQMNLIECVSCKKEITKKSPECVSCSKKVCNVCNYIGDYGDEDRGHFYSCQKCIDCFGY